MRAIAFHYLVLGCIAMRVCVSCVIVRSSLADRCVI